jgi:GNAT superfamily N-acetyltransferase
MTLFCDTALAARIERVETEMIAALNAAARPRCAAGFARPVAGGVASFAEPDSPFNKVAGLGFAGMPSAAALAEIEAAFSARGVPTQIELSQLADPAVTACLSDRGYRLVAFENVLGRALDGEPAPAAPSGVEIRPSGDEELEAWLDVVVDAVAHPDTQGVPGHEEFPRAAVERAERDLVGIGVARYAAVRDGVLAGGGGLRVVDGIAQLAGAATAPAHRRRGIQSALTTVRLADAAAAGCDVAVVTTQPGSKSQQNVQRRGFDLLYARAILVRDAA